MEWKIEYVAQDSETEMGLRVWNPNGLSWFWSVFDEDGELGAVSTLPGFDTKEEAMKAAEEYLASSK